MGRYWYLHIGTIYSFCSNGIGNQILKCHHLGWYTVLRINILPGQTSVQTSPHKGDVH